MIRKHAPLLTLLALFCGLAAFIVPTVGQQTASIVVSPPVPAAVPTINKTGNGNLFAISSSVPADGCGTWNSGNLDSTGVACGSGGGGGAAGATLFSSTTTAGPSNSAAETSLIGTVTGSKTIAANTFTNGAVLETRIQGFFSLPAVADSITLKLKCGSTVLGSASTTLPAGILANGTFRMWLMVTAQGSGASGALMTNGLAEFTGSALAPSELKVLNTSNVAFDFTTACAMDITAQWGGAQSGESISGTNASAWIPGAPVTSVFGQTGAVNIPVTTTDIATPANPGAGTTKWYTKSGTLCSLSTAGVESCTGGGGGGGSTIASTTFASLPATCTSGNLYLFTDSAIGKALCGASNTYTYFSDPLGQIRPPVIGSFTAVNSPTTDTTKGGIVLTAPASSSDNIRMLVQAVPGVPYTMTGCWISSNAYVNYLPAGIVLYDGTKIVLMGAYNDSVNGGAAMRAVKYNSITSFNAYAASAGAQAFTGFICTRIQDDGTNRIMSWSTDNVHFVNLLTVTRTDFLTPTQVGMMADSATAIYGSTAWFVHFLVTTP